MDNRLVMEARCVDELRRLALADGIWTLRMAGIRKIFAGLTDMGHILMVCM